MPVFNNLLRSPDFVQGSTERSSFRFEEIKERCPVKYSYEIKNGVGYVKVYPSGSPVKYLKLRFESDMTWVESVFGDAWERSGSGAYLEWKAIVPHRVLPWFCYVRGREAIACYGVKTGADCFAFFQVDSHGITLFLDLKNGSRGTDLQEPLLACQIVQYFSKEGEDSFFVAKKFAFMMCDQPILPRTPVFGVNNWYWAYGHISDSIIKVETDNLVNMTQGCQNAPYMILDDGWQKKRKFDDNEYNGGPWVENTNKFSSMRKTVDLIHEKGLKAGIWFRPLLEAEVIEPKAVYTRDSNGYILDASHPYTLEKITKDVRRFKSWGIDLIKHDFTTMDSMGAGFLADSYSWNNIKFNAYFSDRTRTTASILKNLYQVIQDAAGGIDIIACNAMSHLAAGIHSIFRIGDDNSGISFEWTRRHGINSMLRLPLNKAFYLADPDCAAFTENISFESNLNFLHMCTLTGVTALASVDPAIVTPVKIDAINRIFLIADKAKSEYYFEDFLTNSNPEILISEDGKNRVCFNWTKEYHGSRTILKWSE